MSEGPLSNEISLTPEAEDVTDAGPVGPYPYGGRFAYRQTPYRGEHPQVIVPSQPHAGIAFLDGNDRGQMVVVPRDGRTGGFPAFRFWVASAPQWGEALGDSTRNAVLQTFATDERRAPVVGTLQLPVVAVKAGQEATVTGVLVEFEARPSSLGTFDGGLDPHAELGFSVYVQGFGVARKVKDAATVPRQGGIISSETIAFATTANAVSSEEWPQVLTAYFPCRLSPLRDFQPHIVDIRHVRIRAVEVLGTTVPSRYS